MERSTATSPSILIAHLAITLPALAAVPLVLYWGLYQFGPPLWPYYVTGGLAIAMYWHSVAVPLWKRRVQGMGLNQDEADELARRAGLVWSGAPAVGFLTFHTTAAVLCCPWFLSRLFDWVLPVVGLYGSPADFWLRHLELLTIGPAIGVGYLISKYVPNLATWTWAIPAIILLYKLSTFADPQNSVLSSDHRSVFSYYFMIQRNAPTLYDFRGSDPVRVVEQMSVVAPFYTGAAYSLGALMERHQLLEKLIHSLRRDRVPVVGETDDAEVE